MVAFVIAALALADVPPLNGFYSKWLLYQAVIQFAKISNVGLIFLVVMIFGGILTLVGFLKVIYLVFLRVSPKKLEWVYEPRFEMVTPTLIFSAACIVFGLFANFVLGKIFHQPVLFAVLDFSSWSQTLPTLLIILAIFLGVMVFLVRKGLCPDRFRLSNEVFWNKGA
jgi:formate hydrogenlyase subunit 3/multisubunit Na+/H+ antiporter MnhD subunit